MLTESGIGQKKQMVTNERWVENGCKESNLVSQVILFQLVDMLTDIGLVEVSLNEKGS